MMGALKGSPQPAYDGDEEGAGGPHVEERELSVGDDVQLNGAGEARYRGRGPGPEDGAVGRVVAIGSRLRVCRNGESPTAVVRCPRGGTHLYWHDELVWGGRPEPLPLPGTPGPSPTPSPRAGSAMSPARSLHSPLRSPG
eukprot:gene8878-48007_t